jgi:hypothetical protein
MFQMIVGAITLAVSSLIGRLLLAAGVGLTVYNLGAPELLNFIQSNLMGAPQWFRDVAGLMGLDVAITIIFSAVAVKVVTQLVPRGGSS